MDNNQAAPVRAQLVLEYVKNNPWTNSKAVADALGLDTVNVSQSLRDLTQARKLIRKRLHEEDRPEPHVLFKYKIRERYLTKTKRVKRAVTRKPPERINGTPKAPTAPVTPVQVMLAVGKNGTLVLSIEEARELARQLQGLV